VGSGWMRWQQKGGKTDTDCGSFNCKEKNGKCKETDAVWEEE
jgi:stress response protein SCP2